jgi:hypothetical protein
LSKTTKAKSAQELSFSDTGIFAHLQRKTKPTSVSGIFSGPANKSSTDQNRGELPSSHPGTGAILQLMTTGLQENQNSPSPSKAKPEFEGAQVSKGEEPREERHAAPEFVLLSPLREPLTPPQTAKLQELQKFTTFNQHPMNIENALLIQNPMNAKSSDFMKDLGANDNQMFDAPVLPSTSVMNMETDKPMPSSDTTYQKSAVGLNASSRAPKLSSEPNALAGVVSGTSSTRTPLPSSKKTAAPAKSVKKDGTMPTPARSSTIKGNKASSTSPGNTEAESPQAKPKKAAPPKTTKTPKAPKAATGTNTKPSTSTSASAANPKPKGKGNGKTEGSPTAGGKRKAGQMTSASSEAGPSKTNQSPASKQIALVERETAAAEARIQAAAEKRKLLEKHLQAMKEAKVQREKVRYCFDMVWEHAN